MKKTRWNDKEKLPKAGKVIWCYVITIVIASCILTLVYPGESRAVNAYVYLKDARRPIYIVNLKFHYYRDYAGTEEIVVMLPEEGKYSSYPLQDLRRIRFLEIPGYRNFLPTYRLQIFLNQTAHWREVILMPLKKLTGIHTGRKWELDLSISPGEAQGLLIIQKIIVDKRN